jgi:hypothetical protein
MSTQEKMIGFERDKKSLPPEDEAELTNNVAEA